MRDAAAEDLTQSGKASKRHAIEIACDESGSEGENLIGGNTDVFAHASVHMSVESAATCIEEIRNRVRSPATEYKANHLLREKHRSVLTWLLEPAGPIYGKAHVHLTDKAFFVLGRLVDLLLGDGADSWTSGGLGQDHQLNAVAVALYQKGRRTFGRELWRAFLEASNDLVRTKNRWDGWAPGESFFHMLDVLRAAESPGEVGHIIDLLAQARQAAEAFREQLLDESLAIPPLDPLIPAIVRAVAYWGGDGRPVSIVHDEQNALTEGRIAQLKEMFSRSRLHHLASGALISVTLVYSRSDPRVQLADFLAGVARKITSDELNQRGDAELSALLRPYVDRLSIWADRRSWSLLRPTSTAPA